MGDGDGGGGGEGGSADRAWLPIYGRVEAMLSKSQAQSGHARLEAVNKIQRESWEAAQKLQRSVEELQAAGQKKDAEIDRLRAEAADARKADASRRRWEAAYMELLIGAYQKLAELRDSDLVDSRTCAESPESTIQLKESRAKFSQGTADHEHIASDLSAELRKLKQAYETLSSKKDKQISALLAEKDLKDFLRNQLSIMEQDYSVLLKNKKVEAAKASEAAQKLQQNVDELQVSVRKKDNEIGRLQAEAVDFKKKLQKMYSLAKEKDDEIQRLKDGDPETIQKCVKDINQTHKKSTADGPAGKSKNNCPRQMIEEDGQAETSQKRKRACASSLSNDEEQSGSYDDDDDDDDDDEQNGNFHDDEGDEQSGSYDDGDDDNNNEQSGNFDDDDDSDDQSGSDDETTNNQVQNPRGKPKRKRDAWNAQVANSESNSESNGAVERRWTSKAPAPLRSRKLVTTSCRRAMVPTGNWAQYVNDVKDSLGQQPDKHEEFIQFLHNFEAQTIGAVARTMKVLLDGHPELIRRFNAFLPNSCQIQLKRGNSITIHKEKKPMDTFRQPLRLRVRARLVRRR